MWILAAVVPRRIVCPCEDITEEEVLDAVERGYATIEAVKRANGVATGLCQGRVCLLPLQRLLSERTGASLEKIGTITHRPPVTPIPLGLLAGEVFRDSPGEGER